MTAQGGDDEDGEGGGSDIGALLGNLGPLIGGLSGVSTSENRRGGASFICCVKHLFLCSWHLCLAFLISNIKSLHTTGLVMK